MQRRQLLKLSALAALRGSFPAVLSRALELPALDTTRSIRDVEHIIFLMQENRSFDHYYGTLRGVRGYGDPHPARLPSGKSVFAQPGTAGDVLPFHPDAPELGLQFLEDLPHDWTSTHHAWNGGKYDGWVQAKGPTTMAYLTREDIPYHYALADAFTICDAYHCSLLGPTDPNRYFMWTGWVGNDGRGGGPVVDNKEAGYGWKTFPERLEAAGIPWKVYQDEGAGLDATNSWGDGHDPYVGNYGDNALLYFNQYRNAAHSSSLHSKARTGTRASRGEALFDHFRADVAKNTLPSVSWICAPEAYTEHPNWPANYGAWYTSQLLDILTSNPDVWGRTALFVMFDENDGFFDHVVPPTPPSNRDEGLSMIPVDLEHFPGHKKLPPGPYGLGVRVPMLVISPWSKGGWLNSQVFDHTSLIRFVEERFKADHPQIVEPNITPWRRAIAGDLTSAFDFVNPNQASVRLPVTHTYAPPDRLRHPNYKPSVPTAQRLPIQEPGVRPARALPYQLDASAVFDSSEKLLRFTFTNEGLAAAVFQLRSMMEHCAVRSYTVTAGGQLEEALPVKQEELLRYNYQIFGPNGFFRGLTSELTNASEPALEIGVVYHPESLALTLQLSNCASESLALSIEDRYTQNISEVHLQPEETRQETFSTSDIHGWYDLVLTKQGSGTFTRHFAGHIENGLPSFSDPALNQSRTSQSP